VAVRKEYRSKFYGAAWRRYRAALILAHGNCCWNCKRPTPRYLNLAHLSHDPRHSDVRLLCPACHTRHDRHQSYAMRRRNWSRKYGQLWLWAEVEWEAFPEWMRPRSMRAVREQGRLF